MSNNNFKIPEIPGFIGTPEAYDRGYDCGLNGSNEWNCSFRIFATPENTKAWEKGKAAGEKVKALNQFKKPNQ